MSPANRASWLMAKQSPVNVVDAAPYTPPSSDEIVIKTKAIAINPADVIYQKLGLPIDYPAILGCDVAGEVVEVHSSLANVYKIGDRVVGAGGVVKRKNGIYCYSTFQEYVVLQIPLIAKMPPHVAYEDAAVLPLGINTASSALFMSGTLGLEWPFTYGTKPGQGKTILIWGASSSLGCCGVQLATHAGYEVVGIASKKNHEMIKSLGASACFDYNDSGLVDDVTRFLKDKAVVGAFDAISNDTTLKTLCEILERCGEKKLIAAVVPGSDTKGERGVKITTDFIPVAAMAESKVHKAVWSWIAKAMEENTIKYMPQSEVVGNGLEDVQKAVDFLAQGVSAKKVVVTV